MEIEKLFFIEEKDWYEIISWAKLAYDKDKNEISGLATAVPDKNGIYTIADVEILKQENTGTNTELDGDAVADYKIRYAMKYKNPGIKFVWWHSHHTMGAFWSGTDENEINAWKNESFSLALVVNLKQEYKFRVSIWKAAGLDIEQHFDTTLNIKRKDGVKVTKSMEKQYKELCEDKHCNVVTSYGSYQGWNSNINQRNLWNQVHDKVTLKDKSFHAQTKEALDSIVDKFMADELSLPKFRKSLKNVQKMLDKNKISEYKVIIPQGNKQDMIDLFQYTWDIELLEYKDAMIQREYEKEGNYGWYC